MGDGEHRFPNGQNLHGELQCRRGFVYDRTTGNRKKYGFQFCEACITNLRCQHQNDKVRIGKFTDNLVIPEFCCEGLTGISIGLCAKSQLQRLVAEREELEANLHQEGLGDEERHRLFGELRRTGAKMHELSMKERDNLLAETARNLGFDGEDSAEIVTTVKEIIEATDSGRWHGFGRGGPRGRR